MGPDAPTIGSSSSTPAPERAEEPLGVLLGVEMPFWLARAEAALAETPL